jgi:hypothetical protein
MWEEMSREYFALTKPYSSRAQKAALPALRIDTKSEDRRNNENRTGCPTIGILHFGMLSHWGHDITRPDVPRCPECFALTIWEFVKQARAYIGEGGMESKSIREGDEMEIRA